jgi:hypothetical protein
MVRASAWVTDVISVLSASLLLAAVTHAHAGQKEDQLVQAAIDGDVATIKSLVRKNVNWNAREDPFGKTILHRIIEDLDARRRLGGLTCAEPH